MRPGQYVCVSVTDTGTGMDRTTRERIFEPFFTTKEAGRGTGLGLAVVFGIVKQSNGHILVDSETGRGTRFRIYLPVAVDDVRGERPAAPSGDLNGSETILVVEDDGSVRHLVCTALERHGYKVISAVGPAEALAVLEDLDVAVDLLVTDLVMPEMSGPLLAAQAALKRPALRVLYVSGYSEEYVESAAGQGIDCLEKPFTSERLAGAVRRVLDSNEPSAIPVGSQATHARQQSPLD
jgi:CheY-like chemotaxis protein